MEADQAPTQASAGVEWSHAEVAYATALFAIAIASLVAVIASRHEILSNQGGGTTLFFFAYGLLTISIGYRHPQFGYYSFDRVSQVASILVLGPVAAACINGLASFVYPWHRLRLGVPPRQVLYSALNNSGLMALITLLSGGLYTALGGATPLVSLTRTTVVPLIALLLSMQILNDVGMLGLMRAGARSIAGFFSAFSYALELGSGATALLVAIVYNGMDREVFVLLLGVLTLGMLALRQFANMRHRLELIIADRTKNLREKTRELERQATRDNLTGLFNRRYADDCLAREIETANRFETPLSVALCDIDLFKQINDQHSHATGDEVLRRVAAILRDRCRATDMIARYGGEEFLLCFPRTDLRQARSLCEQLRGAVENASWVQLGVAAGVTLSFGIAECSADSSRESLLHLADLHLYAAKNGGRNLVVA